MKLIANFAEKSFYCNAISYSNQLSLIIHCRFMAAFLSVQIVYYFEESI